MNRRVLHVRSDGPEGFTLTRLLKRRGFLVVEADGAREALRIARVAYFPAAVVDMDPSIEEVQSALGSLKRIWPGLYLVLLTKFSRMEEEVSKVGSSVDRIMEKPIDFGVLEGCLEGAFERLKRTPESGLLGHDANADTDGGF